MPSKRKIDTCRANGAKGAGKKSEESRQKCAANSLKHGLCATAARSMLLPSESAEMYNQLLDSYMARYQPQDECERQVLLQIHYAMWRMRRIPTIETTLLHSEIMRINRTDEDEIGVVAPIIREVMEHAIPLRVPLVVHQGQGRTWAEAHA